MSRSIALVLLLSLSLLPSPSLAQRAKAPRRSMSVRDVMAFKELGQATLSESGQHVAYVLTPDRGDSEGRIKVVASGEELVVPRGRRPRFDPSGSFVLFDVAPAFRPEWQKKAKAQAGLKAAPLMTSVIKPRDSGYAVVDLSSLEIRYLVGVQNARLSQDGQFLICSFTKKASTKQKKSSNRGGKGKLKTKTMAAYLLANESGEAAWTVDHVSDWSLSSKTPWLAYAVARGSLRNWHADNGLWVRELSKNQGAGKLRCLDSGAWLGRMRWSKDGRHLTWVRSDPPQAKAAGKPSAAKSLKGEASRTTDGSMKTKAGRGARSASKLGKGEAKAASWPDPRYQPASVSSWQLGKRVRQRVQSGTKAGEFVVPLAASQLNFSDDNQRIWLAMMPWPLKKPVEPQKSKSKDALDVESILANRKMDVWHDQDPLIMPQQKLVWRRKSTRQERAVHHMALGRTLVLTDQAMTSVIAPRNGSGDFGLGRAAGEWERATTWSGRRSDLWAVNLLEAKRHPVARGVGGRAQIDPTGRFIAWWQDSQWHFHDAKNRLHTTPTEGLSQSFFDEDHDYPSDVSSYGFGGWIVNAKGETESALVHDRYDVWELPVRGGGARCLSKGVGRSLKRRLRLVLSGERRGEWHRRPEHSDSAYLTALHEDTKQVSLHRMDLETGTIHQCLEIEGKAVVRAQSKDGSKWLITQESYDRYPDLYLAEQDFAKLTKLSDGQKQVANFDWGTARMVDWLSVDGKKIQGALIEPKGERPKNGWPTLVYYYRYYSQRRHEFNMPKVNHRPCFALYASDGYAIFLPDIKFEIGRPGLAALKCLVPGVQKLIQTGVSDPKAVALHGHSWSGYQTAYIITQCDLFACAIAGAPVSNMTSAYGGIRWASGLARQFQYERTQSRLGKSLWEDRQRYIDNSPLFFADRIQTPLLIEFGDADGAVPWYQGIELYLACRRLDKPCVLLQYRGEGHHLKRYANKLDYALRMKQYIDHYCKGANAAPWMMEGEPYQGR